MKKNLLLTFILLSTFKVFAQPGVDFGIKAGLNLASLKADFVDNKYRLGYNAGVWGRVGLAGLIVQPEVYLGSKGGQFGTMTDNGTIAQGEGKVNFTTLDVPVLVGTKIGFSKLNVRFMAGPVVSLILKNVLDKEYRNNVNNFNNYKEAGVGIQGGVGADVGNLTFDVRYEKGLTNIDQSKRYEQKQDAFLLSLGYKLF